MQNLLSQVIKEFDHYKGDDFGTDDVKELQELVSLSTIDDEEIITEKLSRFLKVITESNDYNDWRKDNGILSKMKREGLRYDF